MTKITITEALAEIKTISARIEKKREAVRRYFIRDARMRDPLEKDGGSAEFVRKERQAIADLEARTVAIRTAIQRVNLETMIVVIAQQKSISEWLNWRREIADGSKAFLAQLAANLNQNRAASLQRGAKLTTNEQDAAPGDIVVSVSEAQLAKEIEEIENTLGTLDGKLSLVNATTTIDV